MYLIRLLVLIRELKLRGDKKVFCIYLVFMGLENSNILMINLMIFIVLSRSSNLFK